MQLLVRTFERLLFWLMIAAGATTLIPAVLLPAWWDYHEQRDLLQRRLDEREALRRRLAEVAKQREHLRSDPAYVLRIVRKELGQSPPSGEYSHIGEIDPRLLTRASPDSDVDVTNPVVLPELDQSIQTTVHALPQLRQLYSPENRSRLGGLGAAMIIGAVVLLGRPSRG